jgi:hypothetical protein
MKGLTEVTSPILVGFASSTGQSVTPPKEQDPVLDGTVDALDDAVTGRVCGAVLQEPV